MISQVLLRHNLINQLPAVTDFLLIVCVAGESGVTTANVNNTCLLHHASRVCYISGSNI
jgi:hypothetical protein